MVDGTILGITVADALTGVGVLVSLAVGVFGIVAALRADSRAKKSNTLAEAANRVAADAVARAEEANRIAEDANNLGEEANSIARRALSQQVEDWYVEWVIKFDRERGVVVLVNQGRDAARQTSVIITRGDEHRLHWEENDVPAGGQLEIPFPELPEKRREHDIEIRQIDQQMRGSGIIWVPTSYKAKYRFVVRCKSGLDRPIEHVLEKTIS